MYELKGKEKLFRLFWHFLYKVQSRIDVDLEKNNNQQSKMIKAIQKHYSEICYSNCDRGKCVKILFCFRLCYKTRETTEKLG